MLSSDILTSLPQEERRAHMTQLFEQMRETDDDAPHKIFWGICRAALSEVETVTLAEPVPTPDVKDDDRIFAAALSLQLLANPVRTRGFMQAIDRAPQARRIVGAGAGSTAVLEIAAAFSHPEAKITTYEANPLAARCARRVIELAGLTDRITVITADVLDVNLPEADLAVYELFYSGLFNENGVAVGEHLARTSREIMPHEVVINGVDHDSMAMSEDIHGWQEATRVDLTRHNPTITGSFLSQGSGERAVSVYASYFDARGVAILSGPDGDRITHEACLDLSVEIPQPGTRVNFEYVPGSDPDIDIPRVWIG